MGVEEERNLGEVEFRLREVVEAGRSWVLWVADWVVEGKDAEGRRVGLEREGWRRGWRGCDVAETSRSLKHELAYQYFFNFSNHG